MTELTLSNSPSAPDDLLLCAEDPGQMVQAQQRLIMWCETKIAVEDRNRQEAFGNAARAKAAGWPGEHKRWNRVAGRSRLKMEFYGKVKLALESGYYIVPPFPGQVFAIRTGRTAIRGGSRTGHFNDHEQKEQTLPPGTGEWRNPFPQVYQHEDTRTKSDGKQEVTRWTTASEFMPMEFPFGLVKPEILTATNKAMALKVFDRLSVLPRFRAPDPIVMGEINMPHRPGSRVAFFVAWWLDTKTL